MFGSIAKWVYQVADPVQIPEAFMKAMRLATTGAPGPVVVVLPEDVQAVLPAIVAHRLERRDPVEGTSSAALAGELIRAVPVPP